MGTNQIKNQKPKLIPKHKYVQKQSNKNHNNEPDHKNNFLSKIRQYNYNKNNPATHTQKLNQPTQTHLFVQISKYLIPVHQNSDLHPTKKQL